MTIMTDDKMNDIMIAGHYAENNEEYYNSVVPPVYMNSLHSYKTFDEYRNGRYVYGRMSNPTVEIVEQKIAAMEHGADAILFASGMAAASTAIMHAVKSGGHVICQESVYGPVRFFLERICIKNLNISVTYADATNLDELERAIRENTQMILLESPSTYVFDIIDIAAVTKLARAHGIKTYVDNTWCTPLYQKPLDLGADYVMHTTSKYLGGHSDIIGGCLAVKDEEAAADIKKNYRELFGGILGPMEAWLVLRGLRTLNIRIKEHERTAMAVAEFLEAHPKVQKVYYPGLASSRNYALGQKQMKGNTGLMGFELKDKTKEEAVAFIDNLEIFQKGCSWGGFESLALVPLFAEDEALVQGYGCSRAYIRIFCGLEGTEALIADLSKALDQV